LNDDTDAQERIIKHVIVPYAKGEFLQSDLHEYAGGRLSAFFKKDLIKIRPINNPSRWRRCAAHLINAHVKLDACAYFTETIPNFIPNAGSIDGAINCAKLVSMIHDLAQDNEDPKIICQVISRTRSSRQTDNSAQMTLSWVWLHGSMTRGT
jgi:hypothetical protein